MEKRDIHIVYGKKEWYLPLDDILFVKGDGNYSDIYLSNSHYNIRIQLGKFWDEIESQGKGYPHQLERIAKSFIINLDYLTAVDPIEGVITLYKPDSPIQDSVMEKGSSKPALSEEIMKHVQAIDSIKNQNKVIEKKEIKVNIGKNPAKELVKFLNKNKRKEVLGAYAIMKELKCPIEELNDEHLLEAGYEYVDLGLTSGTLWATQDLNRGSYFAWGELYENDVFDEDNYIHKSTLDSIVDPNTSSLLSQFDAAHHFRGGGWRIPTKEECEELLSECILCWCITQDKKYGCLLTGPNGNHIFLQANGYMRRDRLMQYKKICSYWSSSNIEFDRPSTLYISEFEGEELEINSGLANKEPYYGLPIRPVISKNALTTAEGNKKHILILDDYFADDDDIIMRGFAPTVDGWIIKRLTLPLNPDEARNLLANALKAFNPDAVVAFKSACFWGQQIKEKEGRVIFLVEPAWKMSEAMERYVKEEQEILDEKEQAEIQDLIVRYKKGEEKLTQNKLGEDCWVLEEDPGDADEPQFYWCSAAELSPVNDRSRWAETRLYPIIKEVTEGQYRDENGKRTLYGEKYHL